jgi:hypothetical protein
LAIITPDQSIDVPLLGVLARAEANAYGGSPDVTTALRVAVLYKLRTLYAPQADANYDALADRFNDHAGKLTKAMSVVDPESDMKDIFDAAQTVRSAYRAAEEHALHLSSMLPALKAAAILTGRLPGSADSDEFTLPLVADLTGVHRRKAWNAYETDAGRTGRWGAIVAAGGTVRAANLDRGLEPYGRPPPIEKKQVHNGIGISYVDVDPADAEHAESVPA